MLSLACVISVIATIVLAYMHITGPAERKYMGYARGYENVKRVTLLEVFLPLLVIPAVLLAKYTTETAMTSDTEYFGGYVTSATYTEDWDERVSCRHPKYCTRPSTCGSGKTRRSCTKRYRCGDQHAFDVDFHPAHWTMEDSNGSDFSISEGKYKSVVNTFGNESFVEMNRRFHSNDGDAYKTTFPINDRDRTLVTTIPHSYENRLAVSDSVFNYVDLKEEEKKGLFNYPELVDNYAPAVLVQGQLSTKINGGDLKKATRTLDFINAYLGRQKQIRVWFLIFPVGTDQEIAKRQEGLWKNGNKNELTILVAPKEDGSLAWATTFSWMKSIQLGVDIREQLMTQYEKRPLDLVEFGTWLEPIAQKQYVRKPFEEFSYLSIRPPLWVTILVWVFAILLNGGIMWWVNVN